MHGCIVMRTWTWPHGPGMVQGNGITPGIWKTSLASWNETLSASASLLLSRNDRIFVKTTDTSRRHSTPPPYHLVTHSSRLLATRQWHAWPSGMRLLLARRARPSPDGLTRRGSDYVGDKGMCGSRPPFEGTAFVLSFSTATDGASATYPNGASDSDAWARVPEIGIHPERVSRGGRGKGLAARGARRG